MRTALRPAWGNAVPEIKIVSTTAMKTSLDDLTAEFERATGHTLALSFGPSARIKKQVAEGEQNDVTIATNKGIDELIAQGGIYAELVKIQQRVVNEQSVGTS